MCKFHDPSIIGSRDTEGGSKEVPPPPQSQTDPKKPSLNRVNVGSKSISSQLKLSWEETVLRKKSIPLLHAPLRFGLILDSNSHH